MNGQNDTTVVVQVLILMSFQSHLSTRLSVLIRATPQSNQLSTINSQSVTSVSMISVGEKMYISMILRAKKEAVCINILHHLPLSFVIYMLFIMGFFFNAMILCKCHTVCLHRNSLT